MIPVLETERLLMRGWSLADTQPMAVFYADEPLAKFVGGPTDAAGAWRICAQEAGHWALRGYGHWVLEEKASGVAVGWCGFYEPGGWPELEIGWALFRPHQGKGYATESAHRARDFAYREMGRTTLVSYIAPENDASRRVAARLGAELETMVELRGKPRQAWRHPGPHHLDN